MSRADSYVILLNRLQTLLTSIKTFSLADVRQLITDIKNDPNYEVEATAVEKSAITNLEAVVADSIDAISATVWV